MADIVALVRAEHVRARQLFAVLLRRPRDRAAVARMWAEFAELIEAHVAAAQRPSTGYFRWLDRGMTVLGDNLDIAARRELACQWRAFMLAWSVDRGTRQDAESWVSW